LEDCELWGVVQMRFFFLITLKPRVE